MQNLSDSVWHIGCFIGVMAAAAMGQTPSLSLELMEINSIPICGGGVTRMTVAPRDLLIAKVFVRDWSPNGEQLRGYQAELNHDSFTSGTAGYIRPAGYQTTTLSGLQNPKNAFIDLTDPTYIHFGEQAIAFVDTDHISPGYRWISVLFIDAGPVSLQDGSKVYCGTLKLVVSEEAEGTFTIDFQPGSESTTLRTPAAAWIEPLELEPLTLTVTRGERPAWISSSTPQDGSIDARWFSPKGGKRAAGWRKVELVFSAEPGSLSVGDFTTEDGTAAPPRIASVQGSGKKVELVLDRPITRDAWTTITHSASGTRTRIGLFPGDVDNDGVADPRDLHLLIDGLNGVVALPIYRTDLDDSGTPGASDVLRLVAALNEA